MGVSQPRRPTSTACRDAAGATAGTSTLVFPVDANGNQTSDIPLRIVDNSGKYGYFYGFYLQDEWKPFE